MARRRTGLGNVRAPAVARYIRTLHPDLPAGLSRLDLFTRFCALTPKSPPRTASVSTPCTAVRESRASQAFLASGEWRRLRMKVIKERGAKCECCGATPADGVTVINVDHVKPRKTHPELALAKSNLQVLCHVCNHGKGNWDDTDWRPESRESQTLSPRESVHAAVCEQDDIVAVRNGTSKILTVEADIHERLMQSCQPWTNAKFRGAVWTPDERDMRPRLVKR